MAALSILLAIKCSIDKSKMNNHSHGNSDESTKPSASTIDSSLSKVSEEARAQHDRLVQDLKKQTAENEKLGRKQKKHQTDEVYQRLWDRAAEAATKDTKALKKRLSKLDENIACRLGSKISQPLVVEIVKNQGKVWPQKPGPFGTEACISEAAKCMGSLVVLLLRRGGNRRNPLLADLNMKNLTNPDVKPKNARGWWWYMMVAEMDNQGVWSEENLVQVEKCAELAYKAEPEVESWSDTQLDSETLTSVRTLLQSGILPAVYENSDVFWDTRQRALTAVIDETKQKVSSKELELVLKGVANVNRQVLETRGKWDQKDIWSALDQSRRVKKWVAEAFETQRSFMADRSDAVAWRDAAASVEGSIQAILALFKDSDGKSDAVRELMEAGRSVKDPSGKSIWDEISEKGSSNPSFEQALSRKTQSQLAQEARGKYGKTARRRGSKAPTGSTRLPDTPINASSAAAMTTGASRNVTASMATRRTRRTASLTQRPKSVESGLPGSS